MSISAADIKSASFGSDVTELEELTLTNKGIHDLGVIHTVPRLTTLNLAFNCLASLSGLHVLQRLVSLNVSHNALTSLSAVSQLPSLASLNASNNKVASIAGLSACGSLRDLFVQGNLLSSVGELRVLSGLTSLQRLCLHPSPATKKADPPSYRAAIAALCSGLKVLDAAPVSDSERAACGLKDSEDFFDAFVAACSGPGLEGLLSGGYSSGSAAKPPPHGPLSSHSAPSSLSGGGSPSRGGGVNSGRLSFGQSGSLPNRRGVGRFAGLSPPPTHSALSSTSLRLLRETATLADLAAASPRGTDEDGGGAGGDGGGGGDDASSVVSGISMRSGSSMVSGGSDKRPGRRRTGGSSHSLFTAGSMPLPKPVPENAGFADVLSCLPTFEGKFSAPPKGPPRRGAAGGAAAKKLPPPAPPPDALTIDWGCKYPKTGARAVSVRRDGSLASWWPNGDLAVTVDADYSTLAPTPPSPAPKPADASDTGWGDGDEVVAAVAAAHAAPAYRMFAAFRSTGNVAISWDATGGFVQYPTGAIMMIYSTDTGSGTAYRPAGDPYLRWKDGGEGVPVNIDCQLDATLGVRFVTGSRRLELYLGCEGLKYLFLCGCNGADASWSVPAAGSDAAAGAPAFLRALSGVKDPAAPAPGLGRHAKGGAAAAAALKLGDHGGVASTMEALDNGLTEWLQSKLKEGTSPPTPSSASPAKLAAASTGLRHSDDDF